MVFFKLFRRDTAGDAQELDVHADAAAVSRGVERELAAHEEARERILDLAKSMRSSAHPDTGWSGREAGS